MRIEAIDLLGVEGNRRILHVFGYSEVSLSGVSNFCVGKKGEWMTKESRLSKVSLQEKFGLITEHWRPKVVASLNGQEVKLVKFCGTFPWHVHANEDELFLVWSGSMKIEFRDQVIELEAGELCVVPRGVEHRTVASTEAEVLIFEPADTRNTGNVFDETYTAPNGVGI